MSTRTFVLVFGVIYAFVGLLGFIPGITQPPDSSAVRPGADGSYGMLLGLFPVNVLHNLVHLGLGMGGVLSYIGAFSARAFARTVAVLFAVLTLRGLIPGLDTAFGLVPLFGHAVWLHALSAAAAGYFGWLAPHGDARAGLGRRDIGEPPRRVA